MNDTEKISILVAMGFTEEQAIYALTRTNGDLNRAVDALVGSGIGDIQNNTSTSSAVSSFGGGGAGGAISNMNTAAAAASNNNMNSGIIIQAPASQFSFPNGRSACTCIAMKSVSYFLPILNQLQQQHQQNQQLSNHPSNDIHEIITPSRLYDNLESGIRLYEEIKLTSQADVTGYKVEHMSVEELLTHAPHLSTPLGVQMTSSSTQNNNNDSALSSSSSGIRQGMVSSDRNHPLNFGTLLHQCREEVYCQDTTATATTTTTTTTVGGEWIGVIITKTPETVLVLLPPLSSSSNTLSQNMSTLSINNNTNTNTIDPPLTLPTTTTIPIQNKYILLDSHPRPNLQTPTTASYALIHNSFHDLIQTLEVIFPSMDLYGNEGDLASFGGDLMTSMYNCFDLYPLQQTQVQQMQQVQQIQQGQQGQRQGYQQQHEVGSGMGAMKKG